VIANCKECDTLFNKVLHDICPACLQVEQARFVQVRDYLKENRQATLVEIVRDTHVLIEEITDMIEQGKLVLVDFPNLSIECHGCGLPTQDGAYCSACKNEMIMALADATEHVRKLRGNENRTAVAKFHSK
jgi:flagellar operon protein (TIGR03826 family)